MSDFLAALAEADATYEHVEAAEGFELHPEWKGVAEVETARIEDKEQDGKKVFQLFVRFKTEKGGVAIWQQLTGFKSEKQVGFTKKVLAHLGHEGSFAELGNSTAHLIGRKVEIQVKHETWDGTKRERVYTNRAVEGDAGADLSGFASQFNATTVPANQADPSLPANFPGQPGANPVV